MRSLLLLAMLATCVACTNDQSKHGSIVNYETPGNLQSTFPHGCIALDQATNQMTPADLYPDMRSCMDAGDYPKASELFALAGVYGRYDSARVADTTAHQAIAVLQMDALGDAPEDRKLAMMNTIKSRASDQGPHGMSELCGKIEALGPPGYYPTYMIQHGMNAFMSDKQTNNGLVPNFDSAGAWKGALSGYLHCPAP